MSATRRGNAAALFRATHGELYKPFPDKLKEKKETAKKHKASQNAVSKYSESKRELFEAIKTHYLIHPDHHFVLLQNGCIDRWAKAYGKEPEAILATKTKIHDKAKEAGLIAHAEFLKFESLREELANTIIRTYSQALELSSESSPHTDIVFDAELENESETVIALTEEELIDKLYAQGEKMGYETLKIKEIIKETVNEAELCTEKAREQKMSALEINNEIEKLSKELHQAYCTELYAAFTLDSDNSEGMIQQLPHIKQKVEELNNKYIRMGYTPQEMFALRNTIYNAAKMMAKDLVVKNSPFKRETHRLTIENVAMDTGIEDKQEPVVTSRKNREEVAKKSLERQFNDLESVLISAYIQARPKLKNPKQEFQAINESKEVKDIYQLYLSLWACRGLAEAKGLIYLEIIQDVAIDAINNNNLALVISAELKQSILHSGYQKAQDILMGQVTEHFEKHSAPLSYLKIQSLVNLLHAYGACVKEAPMVTTASINSITDKGQKAGELHRLKTQLSLLTQTYASNDTENTLPSNSHCLGMSTSSLETLNNQELIARITQAQDNIKLVLAATANGTSLDFTVNGSILVCAIPTDQNDIRTKLLTDINDGLKNLLVDLKKHKGKEFVEQCNAKTNVLEAAILSVCSLQVAILEKAMANPVNSSYKTKRSSSGRFATLFYPEKTADITDNILNTLRTSWNNLSPLTKKVFGNSNS